MKRLRWQILLILITFIAITALLVLQPPTTQVIVSQPSKGGSYSEALIGQISRLNPLLDWNNETDRSIDRLLYSALFRVDERGIPQPDLAESWGVSPEGNLYNVTLRANARWHDGTPITSDDVLFTIDLIRNGFSLFPKDVQELWQKVEVRKLDDHNLKFVLPEPFAPFLDYLSFGILPRHLLGTIPPDQLANADFNLHPIGSGPFAFDRFIIENDTIQGVVLKAFEGYYQSKPYLEEISFRTYPDGRAALQAFRNGTVMGIASIPPDILDEALAEPGLALYSTRLPQVTLVLLNLNNPEVPFFQNAAVRQALLLAINREYLIQKALKGQGILADSPILPGSWAYYDGIEPIPYQPEEAEAILRKEGYLLPSGETVRAKEGQRLAFTLLYPDDAIHTEIARLLVADWQRVGIAVTPQAVTLEKLMAEHLTPRAYQAALIDINFSRTPDPDPYPFWHQSEATGGQNYSQWDNRSASEYLEQARVTTDMGLRQRLYRNFQIIFQRELPALLLYYPVYTYGVSRQVQNVQIPPLYAPEDRFAFLLTWSMNTRRVLIETTPTTIP
uniref:Extracellular solute-binding protein n=1 Tax=uncultured Chloroflexota bacterium TaxID=166587 RepID=H5SLA8_9CHLR|nr:extracellular solute-binding protein [uncultured Chloroflexota bacterium]